MLSMQREVESLKIRDRNKQARQLMYRVSLAAVRYMAHLDNCTLCTVDKAIRAHYGLRPGNYPLRNVDMCAVGARLHIILHRAVDGLPE